MILFSETVSLCYDPRSVSECGMTFVTISTWRLTNDSQDLAEVRSLLESKYFPGLRALGARDSFLSDVGNGDFVIVTRYPDRKTREDALHKVAELRREGAVEFGAELVETQAGDIIARSAGP